MPPARARRACAALYNQRLRLSPGPPGVGFPGYGGCEGPRARRTLKPQLPGGNGCPEEAKACAH